MQRVGDTRKLLFQIYIPDTLYFSLVHFIYYMSSFNYMLCNWIRMLRKARE